MSVAELPSNPKSTLVPLTRNQIRGFWASWGGWALDGMDSFIYALVLLPSLRELLPRSGIAPTKGNVGFYGGLRSHNSKRRKPMDPRKIVRHVHAARPLCGNEN